jgi:hypothetical protein
MSDRTQIYEVLLVARKVSKTISAVSPTALSFPIPLQAQILPAVKNLISRRTPPEFSIRLQQIEARNEQVFGMLLRFEEHAIIKFPSSLNTCWQRFVICKELGHLILDGEDSHQTTNMQALIQGLIASGPPSEMGNIVWNEYMGVYFALEVLIPWRIRARLVEMKKAGTTDYEIGKLCRCPEKFVNVMLSGDYGLMSNSIHEALDRDDE